ncbi:hypothetical protein RBSWK_05342 [Rhodopirellula baltica SWK14]|uniref:Secreted protein n=1 Tax=Rhodopirellula baltica SWK14 TaxID=993516 RepID=L7CC90_RHOBT|nr:hypothetical protein RBSWK_05342 [Rhodopirellula baltica SWK14]
MRSPSRCDRQVAADNRLNRIGSVELALIALVAIDGLDFFLAESS